jgi:hypothetical protein
MKPRFRSGQTVHVRRTGLLGPPTGDYVIVAAMPAGADGVAQYRVRRATEPHERVVSETDIVPPDPEAARR